MLKYQYLFEPAHPSVFLDERQTESTSGIGRAKLGLKLRQTKSFHSPYLSFWLRCEAFSTMKMLGCGELASPSTKVWCTK